MALVYAWVGIVSLLALMLIGKLITKIVLSCKGLSTDWSSYNTAMLILTCIAFMPVAVLAALVKNTK